MGNYKEPKLLRPRIDVVKEVIGTELGIEVYEGIANGARIVEDLGADSLDTIECVMALEEYFGVEIPDSEAEELLTIGDIDRWLREHGIKDSVR